MHPRARYRAPQKTLTQTGRLGDLPSNLDPFPVPDSDRRTVIPMTGLREVIGRSGLYLVRQHGVRLARIASVGHGSRILAFSQVLMLF